MLQSNETDQFDNRRLNTEMCSGEADALATEAETKKTEWIC